MVIHIFFTTSSSMPDAVAMVATARGRLRDDADADAADAAADAADADAAGRAPTGAHATLGTGIRAAANSAAIARRRVTVGGVEGGAMVAVVRRRQASGSNSKQVVTRKLMFLLRPQCWALLGVRVRNPCADRTK